jgi:PAS domain S-box-containing protein
MSRLLLLLIENVPWYIAGAVGGGILSVGVRFLLLFIEIDPWYIAGAFVAGIVSLGAMMAAIKAIRGEIWTPIRKNVLEPRQKRRQRIEELIISVAEMQITIGQIAKELQTNGGSSLKDLVVGVAKSTDYTSAKLRHMDEKSRHALFEIDATGKWTFANAALCEMFNSDEADLLNRDWLVKLDPDDKRRAITELNDAIENRCPLNVKVTVNVDDHNSIRVRLQATPHIKAGTLIGFFGLATPLDSIHDTN